MAQKPAILLYNEAQNALINTVNYFIQQGVPVYEMKTIFDTLASDLNKLVEQETKKAEEEYNSALEAENQNEEKAE